MLVCCGTYFIELLMQPAKSVSLKECDCVYAGFRHFYGILSDFPFDQLMVRCEMGKKRNIYFVSSVIKQLVQANADKFKVSCCFYFSVFCICFCPYFNALVLFVEHLAYRSFTSQICRHLRRVTEIFKNRPAKWSSKKTTTAKATIYQKHKDAPAQNKYEKIKPGLVCLERVLRL